MGSKADMNLHVSVASCLWERLGQLYFTIENYSLGPKVVQTAWVPTPATFLLPSFFHPRVDDNLRF
ncbi:hypothetical protein V2J09_015559 [Rumex salicifolius]